MTPFYLRTSYELLGKLLCPDTDRSKVWGGICLSYSGCLMLSAPRASNVSVSFTVSPPKLQRPCENGPPRLLWCLGVPSLDRKIRPWSVCKASFKWVVDTETWQSLTAATLDASLPLSWRKRHISSVPNRHWENTSAQPEKQIFLHPLWILGNVNSPALITAVTKSCCSQPRSFPAARRPAKSRPHPLQPTFFLETTTVWNLEPTNEHQRPFWELTFSSAKPIDQIFKKYNILESTE